MAWWWDPCASKGRLSSGTLLTRCVVLLGEHNIPLHPTSCIRGVGWVLTPTLMGNPQGWLSDGPNVLHTPHSLTWKRVRHLSPGILVTEHVGQG